jgi:hypothetical protein
MYVLSIGDDAGNSAMCIEHWTRAGSMQSMHKAKILFLVLKVRTFFYGLLQSCCGDSCGPFGGGYPGH